MGARFQFERRDFSFIDRRLRTRRAVDKIEKIGNVGKHRKSLGLECEGDGSVRGEYYPVETNSGGHGRIRAWAVNSFAPRTITMTNNGPSFAIANETKFTTHTEYRQKTGPKIVF